MPNVLNEYAGNGVTRTFNFSMVGGYLSRDYVYFFTRPNDDLLAYTPYDDANVTWISDYTVQTAAPIPIGTTFVILRSTQLDPLVDFQNTSRITEKNLDIATWQSIHIAAENSDTVGRIQVVATDAKLESAQALANAAQAAADALAAANAAIAASVSASAAQVAALQAGSDAADAAQSAQVASNTASAAASTANAAAITANAAAATAGTALSTANGATATANAASNAAASATSTANGAASTAAAAVVTANAAAADATEALGTANDAMALAEEAKELVDEAVAGAVVSFNGRAGTVLPASGDYTKAMVGLGSVDNTSDLAKPLSTATTNALALKADKTYVDTQLSAKADTTTVNSALSAKANTSDVNTLLSYKVNISDYNTAMAGKANASHAHSMGDITGLSSALAAKFNVAGGTISGDTTVATNFHVHGQSSAGSFHTTGNLYVGSTFAANGGVELGGATPFVDFHYGNTAADYDVRIINNYSGRLTHEATLSWFNGNVTVQGELWAAGNVGAYSDRRLKTNITPIPISLWKIEQLGGYTYNRLDRDGEKHAGLIAQEVQAVLPEAVSADDEGILRVNPTGVVALLVEAVKDLSARVKALEKR